MIYSREQAIKAVADVLGTARNPIVKYPYSDAATLKWVLTLDQIRLLLSTAHEEGKINEQRN